MHKLILSLLMGFFQGPAAAPAPAIAQAAPTGVAAVNAAQALKQAPVEAAQAAAARATVKHQKQAGDENTVRHRFVFADGVVVEFNDRAKRMRDQAKRERVVAHFGSESAASEPATTFEAAGRSFGLSPEAVLALRYISRHEGGFDAINTWDRARFSWGFIQFAGGYGLRPALAHFKSTSPELFRQYLGKFGVDVLPDAAGAPEPVCIDPASGKLLRGDAAEQAFGDDPLLIALFIRAGRVTEVKQKQVEAAIRDYAAPALQAGFRGVKLSQVLRSPQGLAMLIDRKVHEGNVGRLEAALEHSMIVNHIQNPVDGGRLEAEVLDRAIQDADARANIAELAETAAVALERAAQGARSGDAQFVPAGPSLTSAREALQKAVLEADYRMTVGYRRDELHNGFTGALMMTDPGRVQMLDPQAMSTELSATAATVRDLVSRLRFEYAIRNRLRSIRSSDLAGPGAVAQR